MNVTLLDAVKNMSPSPAQAAMMLYATSTHPLMVMPIKNILGATEKWNMQLELPYSSGSYRSINEEFTPTKAITASFNSNVKIAGGRVQNDRAIDIIAPGERNIQQMSQLAAMAQSVTKDIFEGAGGEALYGIKQMIADANMPYSNTVAGGNAILTPDLLDKALATHNVIPGYTYIYAGNAPYRSLMKNARGNVATSYNIQYRPEEYGLFMGYYQGVPIVKAMDEAGNDWFAIASGSPDTTSVYIITYGLQNFHGFQAAPPQVLGLDAISVMKAFDVEWYLGTAAKSKFCITSITAVKNDIT